MARRLGVMISVVLSTTSGTRVVRRDKKGQEEADLASANLEIVADPAPEAGSNTSLLSTEVHQTPPPVFCMNQWDTRRAWWSGQMRETWKFEAPGDYVIVAFNSTFNSGSNDRDWVIGYNEISPTGFLDKSTSFWTAWTPHKGNGYLSCGREHIITGMESWRDRGDRRHRLKCSKTWSLRYQMDPKTSTSGYTKPTGSFKYASPSWQHVLFAMNSWYSWSSNTRYFTFSAARYCYNP